MDSCSLCYRCNGFVGQKLANTIASSQAHSQGTKYRAEEPVTISNHKYTEEFTSAQREQKTAVLLLLLSAVIRHTIHRSGTQKERNQLGRWAAGRWKIFHTSTLYTIPSACVGSRCAAQPNLPCPPQSCASRTQIVSQGFRCMLYFR